MKKVARITSKGQITVPREVRRSLGVDTGDSLLFEQDGTSFRLKPVRSKSRFEKYRGVSKKGPSGRAEINRYLRKMRGI